MGRDYCGPEQPIARYYDPLILSYDPITFAYIIKKRHLIQVTHLAIAQVTEIWPNGSMKKIIDGELICSCGHVGDASMSPPCVKNRLRYS